MFEAVMFKTNLIDILLPLCCHGGTGGVSSIWDGVEDLGCSATRFVDLQGIPARQGLFQSRRDHSMMITGDVDQVAAKGLELRRQSRSELLERRECS